MSNPYWHKSVLSTTGNKIHAFISHGGRTMLQVQVAGFQLIISLNTGVSNLSYIYSVTCYRYRAPKVYLQFIVICVVDLNTYVSMTGVCRKPQNT